MSTNAMMAAPKKPKKPSKSGKAKTKTAVMTDGMTLAWLESNPEPAVATVEKPKTPDESSLQNTSGFPPEIVARAKLLVAEKPLPAGGYLAYLTAVRDMAKHLTMFGEPPLGHVMSVEALNKPSKGKAAKKSSVKAPVPPKPAPVLTPEQQHRRNLDRMRLLESGYGQAFTYLQYKTQKARGIALLRDRYHDIEVSVMTSRDAVPRVSMVYTEWFARPCPTRPRHGFVESRRVGSQEEIVALFDEARKQDPDAELVLMPFIRTPANVVLTADMASIGPGHDGATSGTDCLNVPLAGVDLAWTAPVIGPGDAPFLEAVFSDEGPRVVQVRGGPSDSVGTGNWIPREVTITRVLKTEGDLLDWEATCATADTGTVVWSPSGSMLSHYAVHARINNIPVILGPVAPEVGVTLEATTTSSEKYDIVAFCQGAREGVWVPLTHHQPYRTPTALPTMTTHRAVEVVTMACHHGATWVGAEMSRLLGRVVALFVRIGYAAGIGEYRHVAGKFNTFTRESIYAKALEPGAILERRMRALASGALFSFSDVNTPWKRGYGGRAWFTCMNATVALDDAIREAMSGVPRVDAVNQVMVALNRAVNLAHNNGWWLNKFAADMTYDGMAHGATSPILDAVLALRLLHQAQVTVEPFAWPDPIRPIFLGKEEVRDLREEVFPGILKGGADPAEIMLKNKDLEDGSEEDSELGLEDVDKYSDDDDDDSDDNSDDGDDGDTSSDEDDNSDDNSDDSDDEDYVAVTMFGGVTKTVQEDDENITKVQLDMAVPGWYEKLPEDLCKCDSCLEGAMRTIWDQHKASLINKVMSKENIMKNFNAALTGPRVQAALRPGNHLHIQVGDGSTYKKGDVVLSATEAMIWEDSLQNRESTNSLAGTSTPYWVIPTGDGPSRLRDLVAKLRKAVSLAD